MMIKTYSCAMVKEGKNNPAGTWKSMPSYRRSNRKKCTPCEGMEKGYFTKMNYWFKLHDSKFHQCCLQQDDRQCKLDDQSPLITITASPTWGVNKQNLKEMKNELENCPESWWNGLPKQGTSRRWLKGIGNPQTPEAVALKRRVQSIMEPFLNYIRKQHPACSIGRLERFIRHQDLQANIKKLTGNYTLRLL
jgi:hypothetical protein